MNFYATTASNVSATWFPTWYLRNDLGGGENGAAGVREPSIPPLPTNTGGAALDIPRHDQPNQPA